MTTETRSGLLEGKNILVMGLANLRSYAWAIGKRASQEGAQVTYTIQNEDVREKMLLRSFRNAALNPADYRVINCDVTHPEEIDELFTQIEPPLDGLVHSIAYADPKTCMSDSMLEAPMDKILQAYEVSAVSLVSVVKVGLDKFTGPGSIVAMTFDSSKTFPHYNWMGPSKAALESIARYLARDLGPLGIRVNCVQAGPQGTPSASNIPEFDELAQVWDEGSPIGWDLNTDRFKVAGTAVFLLSNYSDAITGQIISADGGFSSVGVPVDSPTVVRLQL